ncbi:MAG: hypothetical protein JWO25_421 [Alphaproteobacteria bacterium]|nr:hypothetical protein [Alphaproteobacteria bacterium]MDB5722168.1 hypothetical protein [Alphaproteobacteria bacterium]
MAHWPIYSVSGLLVGVLIGLTGVGGGSLMTPLLVLLFGIHPSTAVGTDLFYAAATKSVGGTVHAFRRSVDWLIFGLLAAGSVPAALACLVILSRLGPSSHAASALITTVLGIALLLTSLTLAFRTRLIAWSKQRGVAVSDSRVRWLTVLLGFVVGVAVSLSSVGAGAIGATVLILLYPDIPLRRLVGTDIIHAIPLTLIGGLGHLMLGTVNVALLGALLLGSIPGIIVGSFAISFVKESWLRYLIAIMLCIAGVALLRK